MRHVSRDRSPVPSARTTLRIGGAALGGRQQVSIARHCTSPSSPARASRRLADRLAASAPPVCSPLHVAQNDEAWAGDWISRGPCSAPPATMTAHESRACAVALLVFAAAAVASVVLLLGWRGGSPLPLLEHAPTHVGDARAGEADTRTFAHFIYDVYLRQCFQFRRPRNTSSGAGLEGCEFGTASNATHCVHPQAQEAPADLEQSRVLQLQKKRALLQGQGVEWAADDEGGGLLDAVERRGERQEPVAHPSSLIGHIFLGALLLLSVGVALCEVFRDRLREKRSPPTVANAFSNAAVDLRRCSLADLTVSRHARRESVQLANAVAVSTMQHAAGSGVPDSSQADQSTQSALRRHRLITAMSFDSGLGMVALQPPRPSYRILGHRPPPLQRRSSFPVPLATGPSGGDQSFSTGSKLSRRSSVEQSEEESSPDLRRRVRIIRRH